MTKSDDMPSTSMAGRRMTTEEFLALPEDGIERWLIRGVVREFGSTMTVRNREHTSVATKVAYFLEHWLQAQPAPRGRVHTGDAGVRLRHDPDCIVGVDVTYVSAEVDAKRPTDTRLIDGVPVLAVEIVSPNDTIEDINDKIDEYLKAGVELVWIVDSRRRTVTIHRPGAEPERRNATQELSSGPHLPGFRVEVAKLFE